MDEPKHYPNGLLKEIREKATPLSRESKVALIKDARKKIEQSNPDMERSVVAKLSPKLIDRLLQNR